LLIHPGLITRINTRHYGITKHVKRTNESSQSQAPSTQPNLPIPQGGEIPTEHLIQKESQAIQKIQAEWEKIEILQEEKVKLADRMQRIVARARERARAEWVKVGGIDVEELMDEGSAAGGEIVLPPSGLGSGSDVRQKSKSKASSSSTLIILGTWRKESH
jgi:chromatin modification-related protein YNG2